jgi:hypothetical protein
MADLRKIFNKQTFTASSYLSDKWMNFNMHPMKMMAVDADHYPFIDWKSVLEDNADCLVALDID